MAREHLASWQRVGSLVTTVIVVAALYFGQGLFVPLALAALLSFLLAPVVHALERLRIGRVPAVVLTTILASSGILSLGWVVWTQLEDLADNLGRYKHNVARKWEEVRGAGQTPISKIESELSEATEGTPPPAPTTSATVVAKPQPVEVVERKPGIVAILRDVLGPWLAPLGAAGVVFVLTIFMLVYHEDLRDRFIRLVSRGQIVVTTQALAEASERVSRYLTTTLIVNSLYGIPVGVGLHLLGVPNAALWGLLATLLRFIPYLGPWIAASFPIVLSLAVFPDWSGTAKVVGLFVVMELIGNNVVEPWLYGRRTGLSPLAVIVAAVFWTWLWGVVGLLLAIPLTLLLSVAGRYVPPLRFLHVLLRDEPGLRPEERFYQRLVAADPDEAARIAEEYIGDHTLEQLYDDVVLPALRAAKSDVLERRLDPEALRVVQEGARDLVEEVAEAASAPKKGEPEAPPPSSTLGDMRVVLLPAGDQTDAIVAQMLAEVLVRTGISTQVLPGSALSGEMVDAVVKSRPDVVGIVGFLPFGVLRARHLCKRLRGTGAAARIVVVLWDASADVARIEERITPACADRTAVTFAKAVEAVRSVVGDASVGSPSSAQGAPAPAETA